MRDHARRGRHLLTAAGVALAAAGLAAVLVAVRAQADPPEPPASAATPVSSPAGTDRAPTGRGSRPRTTTGSAPARVPVLPAAEPTRLSIPAIGVASEVRPLGLNPDRTVQVPPLGESYAGWYRHSPSPGQLGPSVILGHVDSEGAGPGVFFSLGALRPGDTVAVTRADNAVAVFRVDRVVQYAKAQFPTAEVYGNTDRPALRLITCGGRFDPATLSYDDNVVAYASLVSSHRA